MGELLVSENDSPIKISFCITCKGRLWQLRQTLPANLDVVLNDKYSEIVVLNYNSPDEVDVWMRQFKPWVDSGVLRYVHEKSETVFHASRAKNIAHLAATGEFLFNLDCDNFIGATIPTLRRLWHDNDDAVIHGFSGISLDGTFGRIGISRSRFLALGGYDEEMHAMAYHDVDFINRALVLGMTVICSAAASGPAILNTQQQKMQYCPGTLTWDEMFQQNRELSRQNLRSGTLLANPARTPVNVLLNFNHEIEI
jgi:hypothetical protein